MGFRSVTFTIMTLHMRPLTSWQHWLEFSGWNKAVTSGTEPTGSNHIEHWFLMTCYEVLDGADLQVLGTCADADIKAVDSCICLIIWLQLCVCSYFKLQCKNVFPCAFCVCTMREYLVVLFPDRKWGTHIHSSLQCGFFVLLPQHILIVFHSAFGNAE